MTSLYKYHEPEQSAKPPNKCDRVTYDQLAIDHDAKTRTWSILNIKNAQKGQ
nr:MAG TPA: hypothetical protein [Caudoviricetes sp.]